MANLRRRGLRDSPGNELRHDPHPVKSAPNGFVGGYHVDLWETSAVTVQLKPEKMVAGGDALARGEDGRVVFIEGALPGEIVEVEITNSKGDYQNGRVVSIIESSPDRVDPPCVHFEQGCGGCQWQHASMEAQRRYKAEIVKESLFRIAHIEEPPLFPIVGVSEINYRSTVRVVGAHDGKLSMHKRKSSQTLPTPSCLVVDSMLAEIMSSAHAPDVEEIQLRSSVTQNTVTAVVEKDSGNYSFPPFAAVVLEDDAISHPKRSAQIEMVVGHEWRVSAGSFFQSGPQGADLLASTVINSVSQHLKNMPITILDVYAGIGLLGGALMRSRNIDGDALVAVDENEIATSDASSNLSDLNADVICVEVSEFQWRAASPPTLIIADPGRPGLGKKVGEKLSALGADLFVLVNCDPASMARDVEILSRNDYELCEIRPLDLFPHTSHVETVSLFKKPSNS